MKEKIRFLGVDDTFFSLTSNLLYFTRNYIYAQHNNKMDDDDEVELIPFILYSPTQIPGYTHL